MYLNNHSDFYEKINIFIIYCLGQINKVFREEIFPGNYFTNKKNNFTPSITITISISTL